MKNKKTKHGPRSVLVVGTFSETKNLIAHWIMI